MTVNNSINIKNQQNGQSPLTSTGAIVVVIAWLLDLQLPVQSVSITTNVVSLNPAHGEVYSLQHLCDKFYQ